MEKAVEILELRQCLFGDAEHQDGGDVVVFAAVQSLADEAACVEDASLEEKGFLCALHLDEGLRLVIDGGEDVEDDPFFVLGVSEQLGRVEHHAGGTLQRVWEESLQEVQQPYLRLQTFHEEPFEAEVGFGVDVGGCFAFGFVRFLFFHCFCFW